MKKNLAICLALSLLQLLPAALLAQSYAGEDANSEPTMLIDKPTAGLLKRGSYSVSSEFYEQGGVLMNLAVGIFDPFSFGISYGGTDILGHNKIAMDPFPGVQAKLRIFNESAAMPAIAIGFDSQGKGPYLKADSLQRYTIKSSGMYAVASKNYAILGNLSIHGGINRSLEQTDGDSNMDMFVGVEKSAGKDISIMLEYDFAANDNKNQALGKGNGYLNFGLRWAWGKGATVGVNLKDVTRNQDNVDIGNRTLQIDYIGSF